MLVEARYYTGLGQLPEEFKADFSQATVNFQNIVISEDPTRESFRDAWRAYSEVNAIVLASRGLDRSPHPNVSEVSKVLNGRSSSKRAVSEGLDNFKRNLQYPVGLLQNLGGDQLKRAQDFCDAMERAIIEAVH